MTTKEYYWKNKDELNKKSNEYKDKNSDKVREQNKEYRENNKDVLHNKSNKYREENREYFKKYFKDNGQKYLLKKYGITKEEYYNMYAEQGGRCKICGTHQSELNRRFAVDHNHENGQIRSLLCNSCNVAIGHLRDDPKIVEKARKYLDNTPPSFLDFLQEAIEARQ
jgi:hypothetical protein